MSRDPYLVGRFSFPTKKQATEVVRKILHEHPADTPLVDDDLDLILGLLALHPDVDEKIGPGVGWLTVRRVYRGHPSFWIVRTDGTEVDFSYKVCLNGRGTRRNIVMQALRYEVDDQIDAFRDRQLDHGAVQCPVTGRMIDRGTAEVDHDDPYPFVIIADAFIDHFGGVDRIGVSSPTVGYRDWLTDRDLAARWHDYHQTHANLRLIHADANRERG